MGVELGLLTLVPLPPPSILAADLENDADRGHLLRTSMRRTSRQLMIFASNAS